VKHRMYISDVQGSLSPYSYALQINEMIWEHMLA
jgi:hypothetical protein